MASIFEDEFIPNAQTHNKTSYVQWKQSNPAEATRWEKYRDAAIAHKKGQPDPTVPTMATKYGKMLVAAGKQHVSVTDLGSDYNPPPPPPPPLNAYFISDWDTVNGGLMKWEPWATLFQVGNPSTIDLGLFGGPGIAAAPNGRAAVVANPYGTGHVLRLEIRNSDPSTGVNSFQKEELGSYEPATWPTRQWIDPSIVWVMMEVYLPNSGANEIFGLASGGANGFTNLMDFHPSSSSGVPGLGLGGYSTTNIQLYAGVPGFIQRKNFIDITNPANRNRMIQVIIGANIATSGGWVEAWLDGVNTIPRFNAVTAEATESGPYFKQGLYKDTDASFPNGGSTIYFGRTLLGITKADVGG